MHKYLVATGLKIDRHVFTVICPFFVKMAHMTVSAIQSRFILYHCIPEREDHFVQVYWINIDKICCTYS